MEQIGQTNKYMLRFCAFLAALSWITSSDQSKSLAPSVCPHSDGHYFYLPGTYKYDEAADACAAFGWRLPMQSSENAMDLLWLSANCTGPFDAVWLAGTNGLAGDPCCLGETNRTRDRILGRLNLKIANCQQIVANVVCEVVPQETIVSTEMIYDSTIGSGKTTTTTTLISSLSVSRHSHNNNHRHHRHDEHVNGGREGYIHKDTHPPVCHGQDCLPVCNVTIGGMHLITTGVDYRQAAQECAKYGWSLLDLTYGRVDDFWRISQACLPSAAFQASINSFNGVAGWCPIVQPFSGTALTSFVGTERMCGTFENLLVLCQEQCAIEPVDHGDEVGFISMTTTMSVDSVISTLFTPTTTIVITQSCTETRRV